MKAGDRVGDYALVEKIGAGGFGEVWKAEHAELSGKLVAVKFPTDPEFVRHLRAAGSLQHALDHPGIVKTVTLNTQHDPPYLMMEYVRGTTLRELLRRSGRLTLDRARKLLLEVLDALTYAHAKGVVHRDLKPENILIGEDGRARITDFGLGVAFEKTGADIVLSGGIRKSGEAAPEGTLAYMAPEQRQGGEVDARADVYAAGLILHEMLAGHIAQLRFPIEGVPASVSEAVAQATQPDRGRRTRSAADLRRALRPPPGPNPRKEAVAVLAFGLAFALVAFVLLFFRAPRPMTAGILFVSLLFCAGAAALYKRKPAPRETPEPPPLGPELFRFSAEFERRSYPAGKDSLVRGLLSLESAPELPVRELRIESHVVLVLDISGSMNQPDKYPLLRKALETMMRDLEEGLYLTVVLFSRESQVLCAQLDPGLARSRAASLLATMDTSPIRFQDTNLAPALDLAAREIREFRLVRKTAVPRIYILTDGQLGDANDCYARAPMLEQLEVEVNSYGFGADFAFETMKRVMGRCPGGLVKPIRNTSAILETFQRIVQVSSSILATESVLELTYAPGVIPGDLFSHRPAQKRWPAQRAPRIPLGNLEARRRYVWAFEARLPETAGAGFALGDFTLDLRHGERQGRASWPIVVPIGTEGPANPEVEEVFGSLQDLRDDRKEARIDAYECKVRILKKERRDPQYIQAMEKVIDQLKKGEALDETADRVAKADPITTLDKGTQT